MRQEYFGLKRQLAQKEKDYYAAYAKIPPPSKRRKGLLKTDSMMLEAQDKLKEQKFK